MTDIKDVSVFLGNIITVTGCGNIAFLVADILVAGISPYIMKEAKLLLDEGIEDHYGIVQAIANGNPNMLKELKEVVLSLIQTWYDDFYNEGDEGG
jgi:hypothetical protein